MGSVGPTVITFPYKPRALQRDLHACWDTHRQNVAVCHRRFGKTVAAVNQLIKAAVTCPRDRPRFAYIAPTYAMGKQVAWDYIQHFAAPAPGLQINQAELRADFLNGGQVRIFGASNPDSLRGIYLDGVVFDEFGMMAKNIYSEVVRPALTDREGWMVFLGTPAGKNQFYEVATEARGNPAWGFREFKASQTGLISEAELKQARQDMTADEYAQEFECSFEAAVKGAIYSAELEQARTSGRVTRVPIEPGLPVDTDWDLGVGDSTAIWFSQSFRSGEVRMVDYYESDGEGLPHYVKVLKDRGYTYGQHWAPHDIQVREFSSGRSRYGTAKSLGITFQVTPNIPIEDGIHAVRMLLPRCWFDADRCQAGLEALQHYKRDYNTRLQEFKSQPVHDWASHASDAFRGLAVRQRTPVEKKRRVAGPPLLTGEHAWMG